MDSPVYSGKQTAMDDFMIFCANRSFLFRNRIMDVFVNHLLLQMESNSLKLSCIRFYKIKVAKHERLSGLVADNDA